MSSLLSAENTGGSSPSQPKPVDLTICILCSGKGSDGQSYRPNRDESQWWARRDALVRCVAASLYGTRTPAGGGGGGGVGIRTQLCLLFDEDGCVMKMDGTGGNDVPTERNVISRWRNAAIHAGRTTESFCSSTTNAYGSGINLSEKGGSSEGVICIKEPWSYNMMANSKPNIEAAQLSTPGMAPSASDISFDLSTLQSKRHLLLLIQRRCPLEFLRRHRLNCSTDVILRKTNRAKLVKAWEEWIGPGKIAVGQKRKRPNEKPSSSQDKQIEEKRLDLTFRSILLDLFGEQSIESETSSKGSNPPRVMAAVLHESCDSELPCWDNIGDNNERVGIESDGPLRLCLFLGAVRDMTHEENRALRSVCLDLKIPLVAFRLGPVPEFTSKILTVVSYHNARGVLGPAAYRLWKRNLTVGTKTNNDTLVPPIKPCGGTRCIHVVCGVPIRSGDLTADLSARSRILWCLVRVCVCSLWRSKLASTSSSSATRNISLENTLSLIFEDGLIVTMQQEDLVKSLAEKHQAAPCEYQVLLALCRKRDEAAAARSGSSDGCANYQSIDQFVKKQARNWRRNALESENSLCCCVHVPLSEKTSTERKGRSLTDLVYSDSTSATRNLPMNTTTCNGDALIFVHMGIRHNVHSSASMDRSSSEENEAVKSAFQKAHVPVLEHNIVTPSTFSQDAEATTITMLQHFEYQDRLVPALKLLCVSDTRKDMPTIGKKRSRERKRQKKAKKRRKDKKSVVD